MSTAAERLYERQVAASARADGSLDLGLLQRLVIGAYTEFEVDRRRTERAAELMSGEIEETNIALEQSVCDLQAQNLRFTIALDNMANGLALFTKEGRLVVCNRREREILSLMEDRVRPGCTFQEFLEASPVLPKDAILERFQFIADGAETEFQQTLLDDREVQVVLRRTDDGGFLTSCSDVTERARAAARVAHLAYHDPLTDLPNRTLVRNRFEQALIDGPCALLCLDLDGFKRVNDTLGHAAGDALLRAVSARLSRNVRAGDTVARLGGDEFSVLIAGGIMEATILAGQFVVLMSKGFDIDGHQVNIGTSIGIAVAPRDGQTPGELYRRADMALYRAKAAGRGCYSVFEADLVDGQGAGMRDPECVTMRTPKLEPA